MDEFAIKIRHIQITYNRLLDFVVGKGGGVKLDKRMKGKNCFGDNKNNFEKDKNSKSFLD